MRTATADRLQRHSNSLKALFYLQYIVLKKKFSKHRTDQQISIPKRQRVVCAILTTAVLYVSLHTRRLVLDGRTRNVHAVRLQY